MADKRTHFGRAGEYAALSEFLLRGYNVAIPSVDVGDDVFVVDDREGTTWRVQVKTGDRSTVNVDEPATMTVQYGVSRKQLREEKATELYFMLMVRWFGRWRFLLILNEDLRDIREKFEAMERPAGGGRPPRTGASAPDGLKLHIKWSHDDAEGWRHSLAAYLDRWPAAFPVLEGGPGAVTRSPAPSPGPQNGPAPAAPDATRPAPSEAAPPDDESSRG
jgi:hypothetical protein